LDLGRFFIFLIIYTVRRTPWTGDQPVPRPLPAHRATQTQNKRTQTSMPWVGCSPTIPVFERAKTVHAMNRAATVIGRERSYACLEIKDCLLIRHLVHNLTFAQLSVLRCHDNCKLRNFRTFTHYYKTFYSYIGTIETEIYWGSIESTYTYFIYLFIYGLLNDAIDGSDYMTPNDRMIFEQ
jgi:hypothetical protein